jgi:hypothetical protein
VTLAGLEWCTETRIHMREIAPVADPANADFRRR